MSTQGVQQAKAYRRNVKVEVERKDRPRLWKLIIAKEWSGEYLGKNVFVFSDEQIAQLTPSGISYREL